MDKRICNKLMRLNKTIYIEFAMSDYSKKRIKKYVK